MTFFFNEVVDEPFFGELVWNCFKVGLELKGDKRFGEVSALLFAFAFVFEFNPLRIAFIGVELWPNFASILA